MTLRYRAWLCLPAAVYLIVAGWWHSRGMDDATGDDGHYLFVAESIVDDGDLDVSNNLQRHGYTSPGLRESHSVESRHGWYSVHNLGLPAFVALPWGLWGDWGARLMMVACCGLAAPLIYRAVNRVWHLLPGSLLMALALSLGMPFLNASSQIYPDLLAGILLLFAADCSMADAGHAPVGGWRLLFMCVGLVLLPWLHIKYSAPALIALSWYIDANRGPRSIVLAAALIGSIGLLACYNVYAFGKPTGPYDGGSSLAWETNSFIVFMGLHFDQAQGMFLQQPLLLLGLFGLVPMWRASRRACFWWLVMYASIIVPNAMHPNWYGGWSFLGRFASTNVLLWVIPLAFGARTIFATSRVGPAIAATLSLGLQSVLAWKWLFAGDDLLNHSGQPNIWHYCAWAYNSLYPALLKDCLPFWQPYSDCHRCPANWSGVILATGVLACGWLWQQRRALALRGVAMAALTAVILPLAIRGESPAAMCPAEDMAGSIGRDDGEVRVASEDRDVRGLLAKSPDFYPAPGNYGVGVDYRADGPADCIGLVLLKCGETLKVVSRLGPGGAQAKHDSSVVQISPRECGQCSSFWVWYEGRGTLSVARMYVGKMVK